MRIVVVTLSVVCAAFVAGCPKAPEGGAPADKPEPVAVKKHEGPTDTDRKKADMLAHATEVDAKLATFAHVERLADSPARKLELWRDGKAPAKLRISDIAPDQKVAHVTDFYFANGRLTYVRHEQGLFMFDGNSLIMFLDPVTQQMKKGVKPEDAMKIGDDLQKTAQTEVNGFH